jgi:hypothetical protein
MHFYWAIEHQKSAQKNLTYIRMRLPTKFFSRFARRNSDYDLRAKSNVRVPNR